MLKENQILMFEVENINRSDRMVPFSTKDLMAENFVWNLLILSFDDMKLKLLA